MATRTAKAPAATRHKQAAGIRRNGRAQLQVVRGNGNGKANGRANGKAKSIQGERVKAEAALASYDEKYLECRGEHAWQTIGWTTNGALLHRHSVCSRCFTGRIQRYRRNGWSAGSPKYDYPEGYKIQGGVAKHQVRAEIINRAVVWGSEDEMLSHLPRSRRTQRTGR